MTVNLPKEKLKTLYERDKLNTYQIAKKFGCCQATVWKKLKKFGIKTRSPNELNSNVPSKEILLELYVEKGLSTWEIEKIYKYARSTVHRKLKEYGIKTRDRATSHIVYPRNDFSEDLIEKAYLIGFRLGDLGVRKIYPNSKTICVASGSTIKEQIELIKSLFEGYGRIWAKKTKDNKINIQVNLNESFDFLLNKGFPLWVVNNKKTFFAFLAGFIDAEGNIGVYNNMARFLLGNYDDELLFSIHKGLVKYGIKSKEPFSDNRKGKRNSEGYVYRNNYWHLRISRKSDLLKLFNNIRPYIKHKKKVKDLNIAVENIKLRNNTQTKK